MSYAEQENLVPSLVRENTDLKAKLEIAREALMFYSGYIEVGTIHANITQNIPFSDGGQRAREALEKIDPQFILPDEKGEL